MPTWRERENNKRRERRRRAVAAKIYTGLRAHGGYRLPKHCDNNEVLKALCREAGWIVEPDGTTYRKGCSRPADCMDINGGSAPLSPCSSYQPSPSVFYNPNYPTASYNPSPASTTLQSPASSSYVTCDPSNTPPADGAAKVASLIPWLNNISSTATSSTSSKLPLRHLCIRGGSISAPVTPPLSSPTARSPRSKNPWDAMAIPPSWSEDYLFLPSSSTPPSPGRQSVPDSGWLSAVQSANGGPSSPTFSLINPFAFLKEAVTTGGGGSSRMWTPGQSGTCSPVMQAAAEQADIHMSDGASDEFAFGSCNSNDNQPEIGMVKPWEGERIHEECVSDELELTLGSSRTRTEAC